MAGSAYRPAVARSTPKNTSSTRVRVEVCNASVAFLGSRFTASSCAASMARANVQTARSTAYAGSPSVIPRIALGRTWYAWLISQASHSCMGLRPKGGELVDVLHGLGHDRHLVHEVDLVRVDLARHALVGRNRRPVFVLGVVVQCHLRLHTREHG